MATERPRRHRFRRFVAPLFIPLAILVVLALGVAWLGLREARTAWLAGKDAQAIAVAHRWSQYRAWSRQYNQILAAAYLSAGNSASAQQHLQGIGRIWISAIDKEDVARRLFARERYTEFLAYDAASRDRSEGPDVALYRAAAAAATNRTNEAEAALRTIDRSKVDATKYEWLRTAIEQRKGGHVPYVLDRNGKTIAAFIPATNDVEAIDRSFASIIDKKAGLFTVGSQVARNGVNQTIETTLDPVIQKAAENALAGYRGSIVAIDPRTNEVLAIASSRGNGAITNLAIDSQYEPGSVIKVLTGLNAYTNGVDVDAMFPYVCKGELMIDGRHFGDWLATGHGKLTSMNDALAVSCNVFFADLGIRLGRQQLETFMRSAGFDHVANLGVMQPPLGKIVGDAFNKFETAYLAIGLQHETMNALHLSIVATMVANRGMMTMPRLMRQRRSIIGDVVATAPPPAATRVASADAALRMVRAMQAVGKGPRGTGRHAAVEGLSLAIKTGTAGERKSGLEALIMAFAPAEAPKIAFGIIAEDAGPAEYAGADIAKKFLTEIKPRL